MDNKLDKKILKQIIKEALKEDAAFNDITSAILVPKDEASKAVIVTKEDAVLCGIEITKEVFRALDKNIKFRQCYKDGQKAKKNSTILIVEGKTAAMLSAERTALNFLSHLSGISTKTNEFVRRIKPLKAKILDTRKTTPGLRELEKYAVRCGGGYNHRMNLSEMVLIKDNHRSLYKINGSLDNTIKKIRQATNKEIEVETECLNEFQAILKSKPDYIMLDNMNLKMIRKAIEIRKRLKTKGAQLEVSGGVNLKNVRDIAKTGVERISIGMLTHTKKSINISMELF